MTADRRPTPAAETTKGQWRTRLKAARRAIPATSRAAEASALVTALLAKGPELTGTTVCAYLPVGSEPGSPEMVESLHQSGIRVLLPVVGAQGPLDWAVYTGRDGLRPGPFGLQEPAGPRLGCAAIRTAGLLLVPALAVDRSGVRLGRGGGYYDRSLPAVDPRATLAGVVRDEEFLDDRLPAEPHDVLMTSVLTPHGGLRSLVSG
ncbi:5-formyltetrahydrofolate cyclo-ligase [Actinoalloteichus hymeniacidonis]|uniref:5-formyltetrahydrofolate cyclo-ligase n=1 Tax=Actinoalloteichus hymeniacidonis TaxID=340345 RepID=A0AAC9MWX8_9PSEU|nr:5-formyltetrahydrofolate cyclo-ligase [Actinoalloteichus hymeniacidonis]AOS61486.1 5,10-methenyltetrahydrofolate synthetase [Actinoalloteichus hymeniacidonis]MBB5910506.1 5-formyltetrahydrofolate cyclo-ligase [Actinoalloteichus hymeniacidonis]